MSFTGTLDKCKACDKTVYFVDLLSADGATFHKSCFKCSHCKGTLVVYIYMFFVLICLSDSNFTCIELCINTSESRDC